MTSRTIENEEDQRLLCDFIKGLSLPFTISIAKGKKRSVEQNRLQRMWVNEIADQLGDQTPEEVRGYCKLTIGVPIMRAQNDFFRERYDEVVRPMGYEQKLAMMMEPLDLPVTRIMTTKQKTDYLDGIQQHFAERGIILTQPQDKG